MFDRVSTITSRVAFYGLHAALLAWAFVLALPAAGSWLVALGAVLALSPVLVLLGNFAIGPAALAFGVALGALLSAAAALVRLLRLVTRQTAS